MSGDFGKAIAWALILGAIALLVIAAGFALFGAIVAKAFGLPLWAGALVGAAFVVVVLWLKLRG